ncbi:RHS repeat domain-containing protein [Streptomyces sp. TR02-1]|uniref:RHS repeat domain-containing protein n=1 Tax=Streptomyces sp. TR02-1 TaxID=3385977 RepID=UPI0039A35FB9
MSPHRAAVPSYFSRKRLTGITTQTKDGATFKDVDSWTFTQDYLDPGDIGGTDDQVLVLKKIRRIGKAGSKSDITMDPVSFTYRMLENRVDATDDILPITRPRLSTITTETGGLITVTYSAPECVRSEVIDAPEDTNTRSCYPQYWHINGASEASVDWFHKYRVLAVVTTDPTGLGETMETSYTYQGAAWHYSDSPFTPQDERTWSDWRGYRKVTTYTGAEGTNRSKHVTLYMQGMDGDKTETGSRNVTVDGVDLAGLDVPDITDSDQYSGRVRQQITYNGSTPTKVKVTSPWSKETARQSVPGAGDHVARFVRDKKTATHTYLTADQSWRSRTVTTSYDDYGMAVETGDTGEVGKGGDESCTRTWYARNPGAGITRLVSRELTVARGCGTALTDVDLPADSTRRGEVLSDTATVYDDTEATTWTSDQNPTVGEASWTGRATGYTAGAPSGWQTITTTGYDALGRVTSITDAQGNESTTTFTPAGSGPLERTVATNALGHNTVDYYEPLRGSVVRSFDEDLEVTEKTHDALGRLTKVWLPGRGTSQPAHYTFGYHLHNDKPSYVASGRISADGDTYLTRYTIYDSLLRKLQTQAPSPSDQGGRILTDTRYDSRGLAYETYADIWDDSSEPNGTYTRALYGEAPKQTATTYDGAGRATSNTLLVLGTEKWSTTTTYTGNSTATTARAGGEAERTITDVRGNVVERRTYAGQQPTDPDFGGAAPGIPYNSTRFTYTLDGKDESVTGPDNTQWTYGYDLFGRQVTTTDPDKGTSTSAYDSLDRAIKSTDSRGESVLTEYDPLGRVTGTWANQKTDENRLTAFTYDTVSKGKLTTSTRYQEGAAYTTEALAYDTRGHRTQWELHLPASDPLVQAGASETYAFEAGYNPLTGALVNQDLPAMGGLPQESLGYTYSHKGVLKEILGKNHYLTNVTYTPTGIADQLTLGTPETGNKATYIEHHYERGTDRLLRSEVRTDTDISLQDLNYSYDQAGNVTSVTDPITLGGQQAADTQCFDYDGHRRLTHAWTPASGNCADARDSDALGGRAPYWSSYTYNDAGQRTGETDHVTGGKDTYCYTGAQPHTLTGTSTTADCTSPDNAYTYDQAGNTTGRPSQALTWNTEGKLAQVTEGVVDTNYLYDASGNLLIRHTEGGERVLYAGSTELHLRADGTMWAQRYYGTQDMTIAVRSNHDNANDQSVSSLAGDKHRTSTIAVDVSEEQSFVKRAFTPFGEQRTEASIGNWVDDKAFIGKTHDKATGLTHIGAREYDPTTGTFLSVDPLLETDKPQTLNGYTYGAQNPYTYTDPTGEGLACGGQGSDTKCPENGAIDSSGKTGSDGMLSITSYPTEDGIVNVGTVRNRFGDVISVTTHKRPYTKPAGDGGKAQKEEAEEDSILESIWDSTGGKVVSAIADGAEATWEGIKDGARWVWNNRGTIVKVAAGAAFVACTFFTAGVCAVVGGAAFALSVTNRGISYVRGESTTAEFASGVVMDTVGWRVQTVKNLHMFGSRHTNFLHAVSTRRGQQRLYQQSTVLTWGTLGW